MNNIYQKSLAITCPLSKKHLIEASAGTGKTFTLTGILLRLLIEKNTKPEHIIATTFTRAAASEMQIRLYDRIQEFETLCDWQQRQANTNDLLALDYENKYLFFKNLTETHHENVDKNIQKLLKDDINCHLLSYVLTNTTLDKTLYQLSVLSANVDNMFIGTLDSLAQKWLKEFGAEIGITNRLDLLSDASTLSQEIVHDTLRLLHSHLYHNAKNLYHTLFFGENPPLKLELFSDIDNALKNTKNALNFLTADIDVFGDNFDIHILFNDNDYLNDKQQLQELLSNDFSMLSDDLAKEYGISGNKSIGKYINELPKLIDDLNKNLDIGKLTESQKKLLSVSDDDFYQPPLKKGFENKLDDWKKLPIDNIVKLKNICQKIINPAQEFQEKMIYFLAIKLRQGLNQKLEQNNQTTFGKQMADLANALLGERGKLLARHIRHLYPVALIDEVQDINTEQLAFIKRLYLNDDANKDIFREKDKQSRGFLLCVGDPKQAIYRFRGGDVLNYNLLKQLGVESGFSLTTNFRSNKTLIDALNIWFDNANTHCFGDDIYYQKIRAENTWHSLSWHSHLNDVLQMSLLPQNINPCFPESPLAVLHFDEKTDDGADLLAQHINTLLQEGKIINKEGQESLLLPSDVAILGKAHHQLATAKTALAKYGIDVATEKMGDVWKTDACQALYEFLWAMIDDGDDRLGAVLSGLFRLSLADTKAILADETKRLRLIVYLKTAEQKWLTAGACAALEWAFLVWQFADWRDDWATTNDNLWQYLARFDDGERFLTDVWQLLGLFCEDEDFVGKVAYLPNSFLTALSIKLAKQADDDKNLRIALPSESAVQLMTIHRSKGLQFKVVYVLGLDSGASDHTEGLYPYVDESKSRRLSPKNSPENQEKNKKELTDETKRLGYVALTRAEEQVFVIAKDKSQASNSLLNEWGFMADKKTFKNYLPSDLVSVIHINKVADKLITTPYIKIKQEPKTIHYPDWQDVFKKTVFESKYRTSFTGLSRLFEKSSNHQMLDNYQNIDDSDTPDYLILDNDELLLDNIRDTNQNLIIDNVNDDKNMIRKAFLRGADAGIFLHKVFEKFDGDNCQMSQLVDELAKTYKLPKEYQNPNNEHYHNSNNNRHFALVDWLVDVSKSRLVSGICLNQLTRCHKKNELKFIMNSQGLNLEKLSDLFSKYCPDIAPLSFFATDRAFDFFSGEIDLLYQYNQKYYVVDYKSNYLSDNWQDYDQATMKQAMDKSGYWLQAAIYQLAVHRLLKLRIPNYTGNEKNHLGEVEYLFLRGIMPNHNQNMNQTGHFVWDIPIDLILALDDLLS